MGLFILGILFGWLLEWLFFNFWVKGRSSNSSAGSTEASALKSELNSKNKTIADLKSKLEIAESRANESAKAKSEVAAAPAKTVTKPAASPKAKTKTKTTTTSATKAKTATTAETKKAVKKPAAKAKAKTATKSKAAKTTKKTTAPKKPATRKIAAKASGDDLTKLSGIGPSMALKLNELGISSFNKLSEMDDDILRDMLEASGARLNNNKEAMDSWNEQAELAAKGDFSGLKQLQEELKK